jgi:hypothetical protein
MRYLPAILVFGAAGASYLYTQEGLIQNVSESWLSEESPTALSEPGDAERLAAAPKEEVVAVPGPEITSFGEVFRFDISPQAITSRWTRVSTGLGDARFQGYRVPLMTGPAESDLAGSLTYYFDGQPKLRRITFLGTTGNPQRLIQFLARHYGFRRFPNGNARVTTYGVRFPYSGILKIATAEVIDKSLASTNYRIELSLGR